MTKETPNQKLKELQDMYLKLVRAITIYLDAESSFVEASQTHRKAEDLVERAYKALADIIEGKDEK